MKPNSPTHSAEQAKLTERTPSNTVCDACDPVMAGHASTYPLSPVGMLVTPAAAVHGSMRAEEEIEPQTGGDGGLDEREAMALEGGVPPAFARVFAALQVARPASVEERRWYQAIHDVGGFLDQWGGVAERLGWKARDVIGPQFTPAVLAWALRGAHVIGLTSTSARLSDGRTFIQTATRGAIETDREL
jgi:hypothetical protein